MPRPPALVRRRGSTLPPARRITIVSKQCPSTVRRFLPDKLTAAYWNRRLYRNSYTREGRTCRVGHWCVKVQHEGQRQTWSLAAGSRAAAAREALDRYRALVGAPRAGGTAASAETIPARPRLVRRPYPAPRALSGELSAWLPEMGGTATYYPLGTAHARVAGRRAHALQRRLLRLGPAAQRQASRELTISLEWSANPVVWTYFTLITPPSSPRVTARITSAARSEAALSVALVEPDPGLRSALAAAVNQQTGFRCVAEFPGVHTALAGLTHQPVSLLLANQSLDGLSGAALLDRLHLLRPQIPGLLYSAYADSDRLFAATPGGASGYLLKRTPLDRCLDPLVHKTSLPADRSALSRQALQWFQGQLGPSASANPTGELARLTARELEILSLLSKGFLDKEIAQSLNISVWTVHGHAKNIYEKLGVHSRTEAAVRYLQK